MRQSSVDRYRLGLLVCGHVHPEARQIGGDYPELFDALFAPLDIDIVVYEADRGQLPASLDECDGWITSPARASVNDNQTWIRDAENLLRRMVDDERPFVGICFGHQLLARALGGRVVRAPGGWGVGAQRYDIVRRCAWMDPPVETVRLIASHEDQVTRLPNGARRLARSDSCPNAMFAVGDRAIGIQAHPEFTAALSLALTNLRRELIGETVAELARASLLEPIDRQLAARWISHFLRGE